MQHTELNLDQIKTKDLLYYDADFSEICFRFCAERDIDCMPALNDPRKFYRRTNAGFEEDRIEEDRMVEGGLSIFEPLLLEYFRNTPILFVFKNNRLTGVVHFSDYNRPEVDLYLFSVLSAYEKALRRLLVLHKFSDQNLLDFFMINSNKAKKSGCEINLRK